MWAIQVEQRNMQKQAREATIVSRPASDNKLGSSASVPLESDSNQTYVLSVATKRKRGSTSTTSRKDVNGSKRLRLGY
jgi:mRNA-degrading endonuclease toxin of MazEF toxin-antitoxin module